MTSRKVAVLIPCYNEAATIAKVVQDFRKALPQAEIHVFDNNSSDDSAASALEQGAHIQHVALQGKGHVMRRLFADIEADVYLLVDGDDTYDATAAPRLIQNLLDNRRDMVVAVRKASSDTAYRSGHAWGNRLLSAFLSHLFGRNCSDILSGYRALSRRFVKSFPVLTEGFEIETELTIHALELKMSVGELETMYKERPSGSQSKLRTYRDGLRILATMLRLFAAERPLVCYGLVSASLVLTATGLGLPLVITWLQTGLVPRFPTAILATGIMLLAALSMLAGLVMDSVTRGRREVKMLAYLREPAIDPSVTPSVAESRLQ